ncbi:Uncharacterised protein [Vibrio cholerae]|nr:Uncharacterised protein [Vibrio cholerae]
MRTPMSRVARFTVANITLVMPKLATAKVINPIMPRKLCSLSRNCCILFWLKKWSCTMTIC